MKHKQNWFLYVKSIMYIQVFVFVFLKILLKNTCFMNKAQCFYTRTPFLFFSTCYRGHKIRMKMFLWRPVNSGSHLPSSLCVRRFCVDTCLSEHVQTRGVLLIKRKKTSTHVEEFNYKAVQQQDKAAYLIIIRISHECFFFCHRLTPVLVNGMKYSEIDIILLKVNFSIWFYMFSYATLNVKHKTLNKTVIWVHTHGEHVIWLQCSTAFKNPHCQFVYSRFVYICHIQINSFLFSISQPVF